MNNTKKIPLYLTIFKALENDIISKKYNIGELLPSENNLVNIFNVSKITIRRALQELELAGYISIKKGKGSIVLKKNIGLHLNNVNSFSQEAIISGERPSSVILSFKTITPDTNILNILELSKNINIYYLKRLRLKTARIVGISEQFIRKDNNFLLTESDLTERLSIYEMYEKQGFIINNAIETIEAIMPTYDIKKELHLDDKVPIFKKTRITYDTNNNILEYSKNFYSSNEYKYVINLKK